MASPSQILANQRNAQASTGPSTPAGKFTSSKNAMRHGLSAAFSVLGHESREQFEELESGYVAEFQPLGEHETFLVSEMVQARWKLRRIQRLEAAAFEHMLTMPGSGDHPDSRILAAITGSGNALDKLARYAAAANRAYYQAHRELIKVRACRVKTKAKAIDTYIEQFINSPMPVSSVPVQNNPNPL